MKTLKQRFGFWCGLLENSINKAMNPQEMDAFGASFYLVASLLLAVPTLLAVLVLGTRE